MFVVRVNKLGEAKVQRRIELNFNGSPHAGLTKLGLIAG